MKRILETIIITFLGGLLFTLIHVPLSWMLGPMTAAILWTTFTRRKLQWPLSLRNGGLIILGYSMGLSFTLESAKQVYLHLPNMLIATILTIGFSLAMSLVIARRTAVSPASAMIGSIPGGLSQMVVLSEEIKGADATIVALMQTIRLLLIIFIIPFLTVHGLAGEVVSLEQAGLNPNAGTEGLWTSLISWGEIVLSRPLFAALLLIGVFVACRLAVRLHFPTPYFLGPILFIGILSVASMEPIELPSLFILIAQWSLGIYLGMGIKLSSLKEAKLLLPYTMMTNLALIAFTLLLSALFSFVFPITLLTAFLGMSPGGMAEMGVTAALVGADISLVVAYQMFRILFILFIVPYLLRKYFQYVEKKKQSQQLNKQMKSHS